MLEWIVALADLCNRALAAGKTVSTVADSLLTQREKELLIAAHHDGIFQTCQNDSDGKFVMTLRREFTNEDPAITAHYLDAFTRLCDRGLVDHQSGETFRLTGQGFDIARRLAKRSG